MEPLNWFEILMLFGALQGVLLIVAINRFSRRHKTANQILTVFLILIIVNSSWEIWKLSQEVILVDGLRNAIFFLYGPFYYLYCQSLLTTKVIDRKQWFLHSIPCLIYLILLFVILRKPDFWYESWALTAVVVLIQGLTYIIKSYLLVIYYRRNTFNVYPYLKYLQTIILLTAISLSIVLGVLLLFGTAHYVDLFNRYIAGVIGSFVIYSLAYLAVLFPEVFRLPVKNTHQTSNPDISIPAQPVPEPAKQLFSEEELQAWKIKLEEVMTCSKLYLNPTLALEDIAKAMEADKVMASRVIREGFQLNFYDFVNTYRVEHFIQLSQDKQYAHYTSLALAYEAGFNAKSTFHKVFKRIKNMTPTAYLKLMNENQEEVSG